LIEQILRYKTLFFDIVTTIGYALSSAMNKSLHAALVKICTSGGGVQGCNCYGLGVIPLHYVRFGFWFTAQSYPIEGDTVRAYN